MGSLTGDARDAVANRFVGGRATLGLALRAQRQSLDWTLEQVADDTHVRRAYLRAIEDSDWDALPAGPFAAGYVRLYAQAVGLSGDKAVAAFREELPAVIPELAAPLGIEHQDTERRFPLAAAIIAALVIGVIGWNVIQRAAAPVDDPATAPPVEAAWLSRGAPPEPSVVRVSAATAPPADQNAPDAYETPGLAAALAAAEPGAAVLAPVSLTTPAAATAPAGTLPPVGATLNPRATVHGAPARVSRLTLQARRSASVIVRKADGAILFARQLNPGDAWRAPLEAGLIVDVSEPNAFDVYRDGAFQGQLSDAQSRLDRLLG